MRKIKIPGRQIDRQQKKKQARIDSRHTHKQANTTRQIYSLMAPDSQV